MRPSVAVTMLGAALVAGHFADASGAPLHACSLLSAESIAGATGGQVAQGHETVIPSGPQKGATTWGCLWAGKDGMVSVLVAPAPTGAAREAGLAKIREAFDKARSQGWTEQQQSFGSIRCLTMTPPPGQKGMPILVGCMGEARGMGIGVWASSPARAVAMGKVKALFDEVSSRLP